MNHHTRIPYRPEIDGLRAVAIASVVLYHAQTGLAAGFLGVDVFFVISGYLITALLLEERRQTGRIDLVAFYARRFRRIMPAAIVAVVATVALSWALLHPTAAAKVAQSAAAAALFVANLYFQAGTGYFDGSAEQMPLLHMWSLSVEEQFYFVWPLLLVALPHRRVVPALLVLGALSLLVAEYLLDVHPEAAFYQMPARFWELAAGGCIAALPANTGRGRGYAAVGAAIILASLVWRFAHFPGLGAAPAVVGTSLVLYAIHGGAPLGFTGRVLAARPMVALGLISYSLYLWHWPLLALYRATVPGIGQTSTRLAICAAAVVVAAASYRYVETPLRRAGSSGTGRVVGVGVAASVLLALVTWSVGSQLRTKQSTDPAEVAAAFAERDMPSNFVQCHYLALDRPEDFPREHCESVRGLEPSIAVWGDSYALAWQPLVWEAARRSERSAIAYSRNLCPPYLDYHGPENRLADRICRTVNDRIPARIERYDTVILVARWFLYYRPESQAAAELGLKRSLDRLAPSVRRIVVIGPTPEMRDDVPRCIRAGTPDRCAVPRADFDRDAAPVRESLRRIASAYKNVEYADPVDYFCTPTQCPPQRNGVALYWDNNHPSTSVVRIVADDYVARRAPFAASPP